MKDNQEKIAIVLCGVQASGKTSFYQQNYADKGYVHINLDTLHTRNKELLLMEDCAMRELSVVVDNTNPTITDRKRYIDFFRNAGYKVMGFYFQSNVHECLKRNSNREHPVKDLAILGTYGKLKKPTMSEGFNELYYVAIVDNHFIINPWKDEI